MVRGFVKQQKIRARQQQTTQRNATTFTTRQLGDISIVRWATQCIHGDFYVAIKAPCISSGNLVFQFCLQCAHFFVIGIGVTPHSHHFFVASEHVANGGHAVHHIAQHVLGGVELRFLLQQSHGEPGGEASLAGVAVVKASHDAQEAGLSAAVRADDPNFGPRIERERDVLKDGAVGRIEPAELVTGVNELVRHGDPRLVGRDGGSPCPLGMADTLETGSL